MFFKFDYFDFYLVVDYQPRIRNGLNLLSNVPFFDISTTTVSCEAITDNLSIANGIQFYTMGTNNLPSNSFNMFSSQSQITTKYYNLSVTFQLSTYNVALYNSNTIYMCCTTLQGTPTSSCTQVYLKGNALNINTNPPPTVTTPTTIPTTTTSKPSSNTTTKVTVATTKPGTTTVATTVVSITTTITASAVGLLTGQSIYFLYFF